MNDELNELRLKLELATAPADSQIEGDEASIDLETGDAETTALRDTWLAFGRLLEAADEARAPAAMPSTTRPGAGAAVLPSKRKSSNWRWLPAALLVVTASLAAVALVIGLRKSGSQHNANNVAAGTNGSAPATSQISSVKSPVPTSAKPELAIAKASVPSAVSAEWDDADDKQIGEEVSAIQLDISLTQREWNEPSEASQVIEYRINEDEQEISKDPL